MDIDRAVRLAEIPKERAALHSHIMYRLGEIAVDLQSIADRVAKLVALADEERTLKNEKEAADG